MKEFLTSNILPYWLIFALVAASLIIMLWGLRTQRPKVYLRPVLGCMLLATVLELSIYWGIGNSALWWCTSSEYSFFAKLLRLIPFAIFLAMQVAMIWIGKLFIEAAIKKEFSIKTTFWGILLSFPITLVIVILCKLFGMPDGPLSIVSAVLFIGILSAGIGFSLLKNIQKIGKRDGLLLTAFSALCVLSLGAGIILFFVALLQLFLQVLMVGAVIGAAFYFFFGSGSKMMSAEMSRQSSSRPVFRDNDGHLHYTATSRDTANQQIADRKANN